MARKRRPVMERDDEFDWHVPLYDQKEFVQYAMRVVLPAVGVRPTARRRIKLRIAPTKLVEKWTDRAFEYLILYGKIVGETRGEGITYFALVVHRMEMTAPSPDPFVFGDVTRELYVES